MKQAMPQQSGQPQRKVYQAHGAIKQQSFIQNQQNSNHNSPSGQMVLTGSGKKSGAQGALMNSVGSAYGMNNSIDFSSSSKGGQLFMSSQIANNGAKLFPGDSMISTGDKKMQYAMLSPQAQRALQKDMLQNGGGTTKEQEAAVAMMIMRDSQERQQKYNKNLIPNTYSANFDKINAMGRQQQHLGPGDRTSQGRTGSDGLDFERNYFELPGDARMPQESLWHADLMREVAGSQLRQSSNNSLMSEQEQLRQYWMQLQNLDDQQFMGTTIEYSNQIAEVLRSHHRMMQHNQIIGFGDYTVAYTCPEAKYAIESGEAERYINEKIEVELIEFKQEIENHFEKSDVNKKFHFQRVSEEQSRETAKQVREINRIVQNKQSIQRVFSKAASPSVRVNKIQASKPETAGAVKIVVKKQIESTNLSPAVASPSTVQAASINVDTIAHQSTQFPQSIPKLNEIRANKLVNNSHVDTEELVIIDDQDSNEKTKVIKTNQQIASTNQKSDNQNQQKSNQQFKGFNESKEAIEYTASQNQSQAQSNKSAFRENGQTNTIEDKLVIKQSQNQNNRIAGQSNQAQTQKRNHQVAIPSNSTSYNDDQREFAREENENLINKTFNIHQSSSQVNNINSDFKSPENRSKTVISNKSNNNSSIIAKENRPPKNDDNVNLEAIRTIMSSNQDNIVKANIKSDAAGVNGNENQLSTSQSRVTNPNLASQSSVAITKGRLNSQQDKQLQQANARLRQSQGQSVVASSNQNIESVFNINQSNNTRPQRTNLNKTQSIVTSNNRRRLVGQSLVLTQNRTPNTDVIAPVNSQGASNINQLRRSQKVGLVKNRTIQQPEDDDRQQRNTAEQSSNYNHQQMPQRAFRRGPRGAAGFNVNAHAKIVNVQRSATANQNFNKYIRPKGNNNIFSGNSGGLTSKHSVSRTRRAARAVTSGNNGDPKSPGIRGSEMRNTNQAMNTIEHSQVGQNAQNHRKHLSTLEYTQTSSDMTGGNIAAKQKIQVGKNGMPKPNQMHQSNDMTSQTFSNYPLNSDEFISQSKLTGGAYKEPSQIMNARGVMLKSTLQENNLNSSGTIQNQNNRRKQRTVSAIPSKAQTEGTSKQVARHTRGATVTQSLVYAPGNGPFDGNKDRLTSKTAIPSNRIPIKVHDNDQFSSDFANVHQSSNNIPLKVKPGQLKIQTIMKQSQNYGQSQGNQSSAFSPFLGSNIQIQPKSVLNQQQIQLRQSQGASKLNDDKMPYSPQHFNQVFGNKNAGLHHQTIDVLNGGQIHNQSSSGASIQGLQSGKIGSSSGVSNLGVRMTPSGPDFYDQNANSRQRQNQLQSQQQSHTRTRSMSKTNAPTSVVVSNHPSTSQSRRNIQIKMKRKKFGADRPVIASHDFQNGVNSSNHKLLSFSQVNVPQQTQQPSDGTRTTASGLNKPKTAPVISGRDQSSYFDGTMAAQTIAQPSLTTSPTGKSQIQVGIANKAGVVPGGQAKRNRRVERGPGKILMMSQDASIAGAHGLQFGVPGHREIQEGVQTAGRPGAGNRRSKQQPVKGLHAQNQSSDQRKSYHGRNANLLGSSYAFTGTSVAQPGSNGGNQVAGMSMHSLNQVSDIYKQSGRQNSQSNNNSSSQSKPPRMTHHRINNFFQQATSVNGGAPAGQSADQPQNAQQIKKETSDKPISSIRKQ